jgi:hypothetical protein
LNVPFLDFIDTAKMSIIMWSFVPRLPDKHSQWNAPFHRYGSLDGILNALKEYKGTIRGLLEIKNVTDAKALKLSQIQWLQDDILSAEFANLEELHTQIAKVQKSALPGISIHSVYLYDLGYFIR